MLHKIQFSFQETGGKMRGLAAFVTLLLAMAVLFPGCQKPRTPVDELIAAMKKTGDFATYEAAGSVSFNMEFRTDAPEHETISRLFNNITVELLQKSDKKNLRYQLDLKLLYKGENCGTLTLYADLEKIILQTPFLGPKQFFFSWEDFPELTSQYLDGVQLHLADYLPLVFDEGLATFKKIQEAIYPAYAGFLTGRVTVNPEKTSVTLRETGGEKTYSCKEYILDLNYNESLAEDYQKLITATLENETVRALLKEKITSFVEIAKNNGDLATWAWTEEEILEFAANLDANLDRLVEVFTEEFSALAAPAPGSQPEVDYRISVDNSGIMRAVRLRQTMRIQEEEITAFNAVVNTAIAAQMFNFGEDLAFLAFDPAKAFDAGKASEEEWAAIIEEVQINFMGQLFINPLFQEIMRLVEMSQ